MPDSTDTRRSLARVIGVYLAKLRWGMRVVGARATVVGLARLAVLRVRRPRRYTVALRSGGRLSFDYPAQLVPMLVVFGDLIDPEYAFLREIAKPDWTVVDAGAAVGQFTVFAAGLPVRVVHAYEPSSANVHSLEANIAQNAATERVVVHRTALSDSDGTASFPVAANSYLGRLDSTAVEGHDLVQVRTLAGELETLGISRLTVLKANVAGFEPSVFAGAQEPLSRGDVDILVMLIGEQSLPWYARLESYGYRLFFYQPLRRELSAVRTGDVGFPDIKPGRRGTCSPSTHDLSTRASSVTCGS